MIIIVAIENSGNQLVRTENIGLQRHIGRRKHNVLEEASWHQHRDQSELTEV